MEVCQELNWNPWEFLPQVKARNQHINVDLDGWLGSTGFEVINKKISRLRNYWIRELGDQSIGELASVHPYHSWLDTS